MLLKRVIIPDVLTNCYILADENSKEAAVIDPGVCTERLLSTLNKNELVVKYLILTHGHYDHIGGIKKLKEMFPDAKVVIGKNDEPYLYDETTLFDGAPSICEFPGIKADVLVSDGDVISVGDISLKVIETPGHTKGGVSYYTDGLLFSGDTLFKGTIGRTDFIGGSFTEIVDSLNKLSNLPDETTVHSGHGFSTTIGREKESNQYMNL